MSSTSTPASSSARTTTVNNFDPAGADTEHRRVASSTDGTPTPIPTPRPSLPPASPRSTSAACTSVATSPVCSSTTSAPTRDLSSTDVPWAITRPPSMMTIESAR